MYQVTVKQQWTHACCLQKTRAVLNRAGRTGAGRPEDSGISIQAVRELGPRMPLFGVCMGHQCIGEVFGGRIVRAPAGVMHGKVSPVMHTNVGLLEVRQHLRAL